MGYIYFYLEKNSYKNKVKYIGQTINLKKRIKQHSMTKKFLNENNYDIFYFVCDDKKLDIYETTLIKHYDPYFNVKNKSIALYTADDILDIYYAIAFYGNIDSAILNANILPYRVS